MRRLRRQYLDRTGVKQYDRIPLYDPRLPMIVLWSQKAGSTTAVKWYFEKLGLFDEALAYHHFAHRYEMEVFKKRTGYSRDLKAALTDASLPVVKFVRDPAARAFSSYVFLNVQAKPEKAAYPVYYWRRRVLHAVHGAVDEFKKPFSFLDYLRWLAGADPNSLDGHLAPQVTALEKRLTERLTIVRIEDLPQGFADLEKRFGLSPADPKKAELISTSHHHYPKDADRRRFEHILQEGLEPPIQEGADMPPVTTKMLADYPEAYDLVNTVFAEDYHAYGYGDG